MKCGIKFPLKAGGWSIGYDDILIIDSELRRYIQRKKIRVLEFGSGVSTLAILSILENNFKNAYQFVSIEADPKWLKKMEYYVKRFIGDNGRFSLIKGDYLEKECGRQFDLVSSLSAYKKKSFDVVLIDAPPDDNGEDIRLDLCQEVLPFLASKGVLILHDTRRINEMFAYAILSEKFRMAERHQTEKGISLFRFPHGE